MKELSIQEKAQRYDEAIERAKNHYSTTDSSADIKLIGLIFPELKESEDERIRKTIYNCVKWFGFDSCFFKEVSQEECLDWLEKLGEQMPKHFELKAGHWYICHRAFCCRADHLTVKEGERFMCEKDGVVKGFVIKEPEKYFREVCAPAPMEDEQKSAWSEEDEKILNYLLWFYDTRFRWNDTCGDDIKFGDIVTFLKSIKDRYTWKPSDEQMAALADALSLAKNCGEEIAFDLRTLLEQLKAL